MKGIYWTAVVESPKKLGTSLSFIERSMSESFRENSFIQPQLQLELEEEELEDIQDEKEKQ